MKYTLKQTQMIWSLVIWKINFFHLNRSFLNFMIIDLIPFLNEEFCVKINIQRMSCKRKSLRQLQQLSCSICIPWSPRFFRYPSAESNWSNFILSLVESHITLNFEKVYIDYMLRRCEQLEKLFKDAAEAHFFCSLRQNRIP